MEKSSKTESNSTLKDNTLGPRGIYPRNAKVDQHKKINTIYHINRMGVGNHMIISIDEEKAFDTIWQPFLIKNTTNIKRQDFILFIAERKLHQHDKGHLPKHISNIILCDERLKAFMVRNMCAFWNKREIVVAQHCACTKCPLVVYFKIVHCMLYEFHFNK